MYKIHCKDQRNRISNTKDSYKSVTLIVTNHCANLHVTDEESWCCCCSVTWDCTCLNTPGLKVKQKLWSHKVLTCSFWIWNDNKKSRKKADEKAFGQIKRTKQKFLSGSLMHHKLQLFRKRRLDEYLVPFFFPLRTFYLSSGSFCSKMACRNVK